MQMTDSHIPSRCSTGRSRRTRSFFKSRTVFYSPLYSCAQPTARHRKILNECLLDDFFFQCITINFINKIILCFYVWTKPKFSGMSAGNKNHLSLVERTLHRNYKISVSSLAPPFINSETLVSSFLNLEVDRHGIYSNFHVPDAMLLTLRLTLNTFITSSGCFI